MYSMRHIVSSIQGPLYSVQYICYFVKCVVNCRVIFCPLLGWSDTGMSCCSHYLPITIDTDTIWGIIQSETSRDSKTFQTFYSNLLH